MLFRSRINLQRDVHFYTHTTIDTLDYSGTGLNSGSKVVFAAYGDVVRELATEAPPALKELQGFQNPQVCIPGVVALQGNRFESYNQVKGEMESLDVQLRDQLDSLQSTPIIVLCDDSSFVGQTLNNFLWIAFTRCNPSHDIHGVASFMEHKHWGCKGPLVIDARVKPHHAPPLVKDPEVEKRVDRLFEKGGSLYGVIK